ncbi:putative immunity protein [Streptomyces cavourensis]
MPTEPAHIPLSEDELRGITGYAAECARRVLPVFETHVLGNALPREAVDAASIFAGGGRRTAELRQRAWAASSPTHTTSAPRRRPACP